MDEYVTVPTLPEDPTRAVIYAGLGGVFLRLFDLVLGRIRVKRKQSMSEMRLMIDAQTQLRDELKRQISALSKDNETLEQELNAVREELAESRRRTAESEEKLEDANAELRLWRKGLRSPHPPAKEP